MTGRRIGVLLLISIAVLAAGKAATITIDFAKFDEAQWVPARENRWPSPGKFVQKDGYVLNSFPEGTSQEDLLHVERGVGFAMRLLKGVEATDGRAELELAVLHGAAPSIIFRAQCDGEVHGELYNLVIYNQSEKRPDNQGVNLWKWVADVPKGKWHWRKVAYWRVPIQRDKTMKLGVEFKGNLIRVFLDDKELGGATDPLPLGAGKVGVCAIEGPCRFYSFEFTPLDEK